MSVPVRCLASAPGGFVAFDLVAVAEQRETFVIYNVYAVENESQRITIRDSNFHGAINVQCAISGIVIRLHTRIGMNLLSFEFHFGCARTQQMPELHSEIVHLPFVLLLRSIFYIFIHMHGQNIIMFYNDFDVTESTPGLLRHHWQLIPFAK